MDSRRQPNSGPADCPDGLCQGNGQWRAAGVGSTVASALAQTMRRPLAGRCWSARLCGWGVGLWLALPVPLSLVYAGETPHAAVARLSMAAQAGTAASPRAVVEYDTRGPRLEVRPPLLAQAGEVTKRAEPGRAEHPGAGAIGVIYPDIGEPYRSIFARIIDGIEDNAKGAVRSYPIAANVDASELIAQLKRHGTKIVIALGRQGLRIAPQVERDMPVVVGGVLSVPEAENRTLTGVSLTPDPALLFVRLKGLLGTVKRVHVVYNPQHNEGLIKLAREAARSYGLELIAHEARDLASAVRVYDQIFSISDSRRDALWLPQDATTVDEATILPLILRESWERSLPVFSSSLLHVKKGALFALYPNNEELGRTLANAAQAVLSGESRKRGVAPLRDVYTAVNLRTASHIGLNIGYQQQRSFDFVFPEP